MYIKVKVIPGAKTEIFKKIREDTYQISIREKAKMNMANKRVVVLLSENLNLSVNKVRLISGHHSPSKIFSLVD